MSDDAPAEDPPSLDRLRFAFEVRQYHHSGIWEEQKHFTWLLSLVLSAQLIALGSERISDGDRAYLMGAFSLVGVGLSLLAIRIQRIEGVYFTRSNAHFVHEFNLAFPEREVQGPAPRSSPDGITRRTWRAIRGDHAGVRDYFELLFVLFAVAFVGVGLVSAFA